MLNSLTKQRQKLKQVLTSKSLLKALLKLITLTGVGTMGRILFQNIPSVEPLLALAIISSYYGGIEYAISIAIAYYSSNFFMLGGQGPWGAFQFLGTLLAGILAISFKNKEKSPLLPLIFGTAIFEICANSSWIFTTGITSFIISFVPAIPYFIVHLTSTLGFGALFKRINIKRIIRGKKIEKDIPFNSRNPIVGDFPATGK